MHLAAVIFLLGGRRDEGLARESPCGERPECFRLRALAPVQVVISPSHPLALTGRSGTTDGEADAAHDCAVTSAWLLH